MLGKGQGRGETGGFVREMLWAALFLLAAFVGGVGWYALRGWRHLGTPAERATYETLHTASLAAPALRAGLTEHSAERGSSLPSPPSGDPRCCPGRRQRPARG